MLNSDMSLTILVKDRRIDEYFHDSRYYVEGRGGSPYEIEITNRTSGRIEAVVSVDGLAVTDGKPAGNMSSGYVLAPWQTIRIPGWTLDQSNVAQFIFAKQEKSYSAAMSQDQANVGVIGVLCYREQAQPVATYSSVYDTLSSNWSIGSPMRCSNISSAGAVPTWNASVADSGTSNTPVEQGLGTAFGRTTEFATRSTRFVRAATYTVASLYYDDLRGLKARGVQVSRKRDRSPPNPSPFPALSGGCTPPPGWQP